MKIALYQTAFLGDLLLAVPTLKRLREWQPQAALTLICRKGFGELMGRLPYVDEVFEVDKSQQSSLNDLLQYVGRNQYEYFFCPHYSYRSHWISWRANAKHKIGFRYWWNRFIFDVRVQRPVQLPDALRQLSLLAAVDDLTRMRMTNELPKVGPESKVPGWASMTIPRDFWQAQERSGLPSGQSPYVCLAPGSIWPTKRWTAEGFIAVGKQLRSQGFAIYCIGAPTERDLCRQVAVAVGGQSLAGEISLWQTLLFLAEARLLVANDSGAQHMASLVGTPTVSIFGPTVLDLGFQPWQQDAVVVQKELACRPCGKHGHTRCPLGTHECMKGINAQQVLSAANHLLHRPIV